MMLSDDGGGLFLLAARFSCLRVLVFWPRRTHFFLGGYWRA